MLFSTGDWKKTWSPIERERNTVRIHIDINTICDNSCEYCYARHNEETWGRFMTDDFLFNDLLPKLHELRASGKFVDIVILGGEPTLHPSLNKFVKSLLDIQDLRVSITSNGNRSCNGMEPSDRVRWAFTYHPTQERESWFENISNEVGKGWWEIAISPLIDCWGSDWSVESKAEKIWSLIIACDKRGILVQPTFQFDPTEEPTTINMDRARLFYSELIWSPPSYMYDNLKVNDYQVLTYGLNKLKGCLCVNNNVQLDVRGRLRRCCSLEPLEFNDLKTLEADMRCPLDECTCYGFLSIHKEL